MRSSCKAFLAVPPRAAQRHKGLPWVGPNEPKTQRFLIFTGGRLWISMIFPHLSRKGEGWAARRRWAFSCCCITACVSRGVSSTSVPRGHDGVRLRHCGVDATRADLWERQTRVGFVSLARCSSFGFTHSAPTIFRKSVTSATGASGNSLCLESGFVHALIHAFIHAYSGFLSQVPGWQGKPFTASFAIKLTQLFRANWSFSSQGLVSE